MDPTPPAVFVQSRRCGLSRDVVSIAAPISEIDNLTCAEGACGESRAALGAADISSFSVDTSRSACCRRAALVVRAGARARARAAVPFAAAPAVIAALQGVASAARRELFSLPARTFARGGRPSWWTARDCTVRTTSWVVGPSDAVRVELDERILCTGACCARRAVAGSALARVRRSETYSPGGACACALTPSGRCSCADSLVLRLDDASDLYGGATRGDAALILEEIAARQRGAAGAPERAVLRVAGTAACGGACGAEGELTISSEQLVLTRPTQAPALRCATGGLCAGTLQQTLRVDDVAMVTAARPSPCGAPRAIAARIGARARGVVDVLRLDPLQVLLLAALAVSAVAYAARFNLGGLLPVALPATGGVDDEIFIIAAAVLLVAWSALAYGVDAFAALFLLLAAVVDAVLLVAAIGTAWVCTLPCCAVSDVVVAGAFGDVELRLRPKNDLHMDTVAVASHLARVIGELKGAGARAAAVGAVAAATAGAGKEEASPVRAAAAAAAAPPSLTGAVVSANPFAAAGLTGADDARRATRGASFADALKDARPAHGAGTATGIADAPKEWA